MRLPAYDELLEEQQQVMETPLNEDLFVAGPPGSGKTVLAVQRAQAVKEFVGEQGVTTVTFNRMLRRVMTLLGATEVSTMHSLIWADYRGRLGVRPPTCPFDQYDYQWPAMLELLRGHERGAHTLEHLLVDEGQDLPVGFFRYARRHLGPTLTVFADENQAIGQNRSSLEDIKAAAGLGDPIILTANHRNTGPIAALAEHFHSGRLPHAAVQRRISAPSRPRLHRSSGAYETSRLIANWYSNRGGSVGVIVKLNATGGEVRRHLTSLLPDDVRVDVYESQLRNDGSINPLTDGITILNTRSVKGQEFDAAFVLELDSFLPCHTEHMRRVMYMLCTRARDHLFLVHGPAALSAEILAWVPESLVDRT